MGIPSLLDKIPRGLFELTSSKHGLARLIKTALNIKLKNKTLKDIESTPHFFLSKVTVGPHVLRTEFEHEVRVALSNVTRPLKSEKRPDLAKDVSPIAAKDRRPIVKMLCSSVDVPVPPVEPPATLKSLAFDTVTADLFICCEYRHGCSRA